ncbi:MAG: thiamine pyrophosphate-dependent enzyme [Candidatus Dormiibacterota bacterium]
MAMATGDENHSVAAASTLDVLWVLYDRVLRVDPGEPGQPDRDRFVLSKGHGPIAYYAVLAARGFIDPELLPGFCRFDSPLGRHPDRMLIPGVEISSGSLGHGFPIAVGMALALRARGATRPRVICLLGDGELDEGSVHEAIAFASRAGLEALTAVVIDNRSSRWGWPGGVASRFELEGWGAATVDGRDHAALAAALAERREGRPRVVVAEVLQGAAS